MSGELEEIVAWGRYDGLQAEYRHGPERPKGSGWFPLYRGPQSEAVGDEPSAAEGTAGSPPARSEAVDRVEPVRPSPMQPAEKSPQDSEQCRFGCVDGVITADEGTSSWCPLHKPATPGERGAARGLPSADDVRGILPPQDEGEREQRWTIPMPGSLEGIKDKGEWVEVVRATLLEEARRELAENAKWMDGASDALRAAERERDEAHENLRRQSEAARDYERQATDQFHRADQAEATVERLRSALQELLNALAGYRLNNPDSRRRQKLDAACDAALTVLDTPQESED